MFLQQRHNLAGSFDVRKHKFRALFGLKPSILSVIKKKMYTIPVAIMQFCPGLTLLMIQQPHLTKPKALNKYENLSTSITSTAKQEKHIYQTTFNSSKL